MILEHAPFGRRGFYASFTLQGVQAGQILAAAVFLPLAAYMPTEAFNSWGWRIPFLLSFFVIVAGYIIRREVDETPGLRRGGRAGTNSESPDRSGLQAQLAGHAARRLHGADERHPGRRHDLRRRLCGPAGLRHRLRKGRLPVDPGARQHAGRVRHPVRRQPVGQDRPQASDHRRRARVPACSRSAISTRSASRTCRWRSSCRC